MRQRAVVFDSECPNGEHLSTFATRIERIGETHRLKCMHTRASSTRKNRMKTVSKSSQPDARRDARWNHMNHLTGVETPIKPPARVLSCLPSAADAAVPMSSTPRTRTYASRAATRARRRRAGSHARWHWRRRPRATVWLQAALRATTCVRAACGVRRATTAQKLARGVKFYSRKPRRVAHGIARNRARHGVSRGEGNALRQRCEC